MENWVGEVVSKWRTEGVKIGQPATIESIELAETILDFKFPDNFKALYQEIDGFINLDWQEHMFSFWPLERILEEFGDSNDKNFIGFCDFFLSVNYIGFRKSKVGIFKIYPRVNDSEETEPIATTFEEVVDLINTSSGSIY